MYYNQISLKDGTVYHTEYQIRFVNNMEGKENEGLWIVIVSEEKGTTCFRAEEVNIICLTLKS